MKETSGDLKLLNLKGQIENLVEYTYKASSELGNVFRESKWIAKTETFFNKDGNLIEDKTYKYGNLVSQININYNLEGRALDEITVNTHGSFKRIHKYNKQGDRVETKILNANGELSRMFTYKYLKQGDFVKEEISYEDGKIETKRTTKFDALGNKIEEDYFEDSIGYVETHSLFRYKFNEQNEKTEVLKIDKVNGWCVDRRTYKYDENGNNIEEIHFNRYGKIYCKVVCNYTETEKEITKINYLEDDENGDIYHFSEHKFDANGNTIQEFSEFPHDSINYGHKIVSVASEYKYYYNFDKQGNWVKKTENEDGKPVLITEREINYY